MASEDYKMELQKDRDKMCASVREQYAQITAKLASDLLNQFRTSNVAVLEGKAAPTPIVPPTATQKHDIGVQTELESIPLSNRGSSSETAVEDILSSATLQNTIEQLQAQCARHEAELVRAHSVARVLEANLHQREVHVRSLEADYDKLRAEKDMYLWKVFHLEISHGIDTQNLKNANAEIERLREEIRNFHQPSSQLYQSIKNAVERKAKGLPPLSPEFPGTTIRENTTMPDLYTETSSLPPPPPPDAQISSSRPTSQQLNHLATPAVATQTAGPNAISIPRGPVPPGPLSAPPVVSVPNPKYASPVEGSHLSHHHHQRQARRVPKRTSTAPVPPVGADAQGHIMNYVHATTHQTPHQTPMNRISSTPITQQPPSQSQVTNRSVSSANPTPQPTDGKRQPVAIPIQWGSPIADSIFSGLWKSEHDGRHQFIGSVCKGCQLKLSKDQLINYQVAFEHSAKVHPHEWHKCCRWAITRAGEHAQAPQPQPQALAQITPHV